MTTSVCWLVSSLSLLAASSSAAASCSFAVRSLCVSSFCVSNVLVVPAETISTPSLSRISIFTTTCVCVQTLLLYSLFATLQLNQILLVGISLHAGENAFIKWAISGAAISVPRFIYQCQQLTRLYRHIFLGASLSDPYCSRIPPPQLLSDPIQSNLHYN